MKCTLLILISILSILIQGQNVAKGQNPPCHKSADPISATASPELICLGQSTILTLSGGGGGTKESVVWYTGSCGGKKAGEGHTLVVIPSVTTTYIGRYEDGSPCEHFSRCVFVTVRVDPGNSNPEKATAVPEMICQGQSTTLTLVDPEARNDEAVFWYIGSCGGSPAGRGNNLNVSPSETTSYYGRYESGEPCKKLSECREVTVTVHKKSSQPVSAIASPTLICSGEKTKLSLKGGNVGSSGIIAWYTGSCGNSLVGTGNDLPVNPISTTTYFGRYENSVPCNFNSNCSFVTVEVRENSQKPQSGIASNDTITKGQTTTLTLKGQGGNNVAWFTGSCGETLVGKGNNLSVSPETNTTYYGRYENPPPCDSKTDCVTVTVHVRQ